MPLTRWTFPDGSNGDALTAALTGADSVTTTGGTGTISTAQAIIGTKSARHVATATGQLLWSKTLTATTTISADLYLYLVAAPTTETSLIWIGDGSTRGAELRIRDTRAIRIVNSAGTIIWSGTSAIPLNTWVRVAFGATISATTGTLQAAWYEGHDTAAVNDSGVFTGQNTGSTCTRVTAGLKARPLNVSGTCEAHLGAWAYDPATATLPAPYDAGPPPAPVTWRIGAAAVDAVRVGTDLIDRAWLGETLIWPHWGAARMTVSGTTFAPEIELDPGSTATVTWLAPGATIGGTDTEPTFTWAGAGPHLVSLIIDRPEDLWTLNFGFNHLDDGGQYGPGAGYDKTAEPITGIVGLPSLTGLRRFLAANGSLTGHLNFSGLADLEFVECFEANVQSIDLSGCASLIRLCIESNQVTSLDLNPVRASLFDLRAANQQGGTLTFTPITGGNFTNLYHFCVRTQTLVNAPGLSIMPVMEQYWCWDCGLTDIETPTSTILYSPQLNDNLLSESEVDALLIYIRDNVTTPTTGNVDLSGTNSPPSAAGASAAATIDARPNWTVTTA